MGFTVETVERTASVTVYRDVCCDKCGKPVPSQEGLTSDTWLQYDNVLVLRLVGGYGMFMDSFGFNDSKRLNPETTKVLCHECAHEFAEWLGIDVHNWHTHVPTELGGEQHADHHDSA